MFNNSNNSYSGNTCLPNWSRGNAQAVRGACLYRRGATAAPVVEGSRQAVMNGSGGEGSDDTPKHSHMTSIFGPKLDFGGSIARPPTLGNTNNENFFGTTFTRGGIQRGRFGRGGCAPAISSGGTRDDTPLVIHRGNYLRGGFQTNSSNIYQGASSQCGSGSGDSYPNYSRGGGRGGFGVTTDNQEQLNDSKSFADNSDEDTTSQPPEREALAHPALLPVTEEDKEIFGEELANKIALQKLPRPRAEADFQPAIRDINAIFEEDEKNADKYASVVDEDEEIVIEGMKMKEFKPIKSWEEAALHKQLLNNIERAQYVSPRKVQQHVVPIALKDNCDLVVNVETGSGKSAAFLIPIIEKCLRAKDEGKFISESYIPYALIIEPTRELAQQCYEQALKLTHGTGITVARAYGEYATGKNREEICRGCDIIFTTPGRFGDFVARRYIVLEQLKVLVFDEGDRLLLSRDLKSTIDRALSASARILPEHQTFFLSATFGCYDVMLAKQYMRYGKLLTIKNKVTVPSRKCDQEFVVVEKKVKFGQIYKYLTRELGKVKESGKKALIFFDTLEYCEKLNMGLQNNGFASASLCSLSGQDLRESALQGFRDNTVSIFCVTDLASRGLDVKDIDVVINYDMPDDFETYVHRVGRAGRIRRGKCISFVESDSHSLLLVKIKMSMEDAGHTIPQSLIEAIGIIPLPPHSSYGLKTTGASDDVTPEVAADNEEAQKIDAGLTEKEKCDGNKIDDVSAASTGVSSSIPTESGGDVKDAALSGLDNIAELADKEKLEVSGTSSHTAPSNEILSSVKNGEARKSDAGLTEKEKCDGNKIDDVSAASNDVSSSIPTESGGDVKDAALSGLDNIAELADKEKHEVSATSSNATPSNEMLSSAENDNEGDFEYKLGYFPMRWRKVARTPLTEECDSKSAVEVGDKEKPSAATCEAAESDFKDFKKNDNVALATTVTSQPAENNGGTVIGDKNKEGALGAKTEEVKEKDWDVAKIRKAIEDSGIPKDYIDAAVEAVIQSKENKHKATSISTEPEDDKPAEDNDVMKDDSVEDKVAAADAMDIKKEDDLDEKSAAAAESMDTKKDDGLEEKSATAEFMNTEKENDCGQTSAAADAMNINKEDGRGEKLDAGGAMDGDKKLGDDRVAEKPTLPNDDDCDDGW